MKMSDDAVIYAKSCLLKIFSDLNCVDRDTIEHWIGSQSYKKELDNFEAMLESEKELIKVTSAIKKLIPFEAEFSTENIVMPTVGDQADCTEINTYHIDEFLYDDDETEVLAKSGKIQKHYCVDCCSRNVKELTFISHSMSRHMLLYIFKVLLPNDLDGKQILDIGSRIGAVLYAAYYSSNASLIVGVEMNKECCDIQEHIISKFGMDNSKIKVIHSDILDRADILAKSDVIILNVFDFFVDVEKQRQMWYFFKKHFKKGSYIVLNRSIEETLSSLEIIDNFTNWLSICRPLQLENEVLFNLDDFKYSDLYLYILN